ncbi:MAG: carbohydrate kinase family protein [Rhizobiaceae bacterium]
MSRSQRNGIVTGGTWCADHNRLVDRWPQEESLVKIVSEEIRGGGSACNFAIDIKRLDPNLPVTTIGLVGDDSDGKALLQQASNEGIIHDKLAVVPGHRTTFTDAYTSQESTRRTHLFHAGISDLLTPDHFEFTDLNARILHLGLPGLHAKLDNAWQGDENGWVTVLKKARAAGLKTNLELCSLPPEQLQKLVNPCLDHLNFIVVNDYEIAAIAGQPVEHAGQADPHHCLENARTVLGRSALELVIVHFPLGAVAVSSGGEEIFQPSVDVPAEQVVGTNGAGDAFAAGALYGIHQDWSLRDALKLAHASAAASLRHIGTTDAVVDWSQCLQLAASFGWRHTPA